MNLKWNGGRSVRLSRTSAFTLIEILVVIAIVLILARLLLPALSNAKKRALIVVCTNNLHQIFIATRLYAHDDPRGRLPEDGICFDNRPSNFIIFNQGCLPGNTDPNGRDCATPWAQFKGAVFWDRNYLHNEAVYLCPADASNHGTVTGCNGGSNNIRNASYSRSRAFTSVNNIGDGSQIFSRLKNSSEAWMYLHEEEQNDGAYFQGTGDDFPTTAHMGSQVPIVFADGHVATYRNECSYRQGCGTCVNGVALANCLYDRLNMTTGETQLPLF